MNAVAFHCGRTIAVMLAFGVSAVLAACAGGGQMASAPQEMANTNDLAARSEVVVDGEYAAEADTAIADGRKVIANARMELIVDDTQRASDAIVALADEFGGYVSQVNLYRDSYGGMNLLRGTLTLRVPVENLEAALSRLEEMALEVRTKNVDRQDVTDQYSDIEAQLRNLEATENELRELLAEVRSRPNASSEDILAVHRDLTEIRGQIEQLQGRKNMLDNLIALSTIDITLTPDAANRPVVEDQWRPASAIRDAARALVSALQFFGDVVIWVFVFLVPILLLALIPLAIVIWLIRTVVVRRKRSRASKQSTGQ